MPSAAGSGDQSTRNAQTDQHPQARPVGSCEFQVVRVLEAPSVAVRARLFVAMLVIGMGTIM